MFGYSNFLEIYTAKKMDLKSKEKIFNKFDLFFIFFRILNSYD